MTPLEAVTAADPYPYYAHLTSERPLYFYEQLKLWVASNARLVREVFENPTFKVRPSAEPLPSPLLERCTAKADVSVANPHDQFLLGCS